jgi:hypothetical protein
MKVKVKICKFIFVASLITLFLRFITISLSIWVPHFDYILLQLKSLMYIISIIGESVTLFVIVVGIIFYVKYLILKSLDLKLKGTGKTLCKTLGVLLVWQAILITLNIVISLIASLK